jgi:ankyrin repeat protein
MKKTLLVFFSVLSISLFAQTPKIVVAAAKGNIKKVTNLIKKGCVNDKSRTKWSALAYAVNRNDLPMTQLLLENNADVNTRINTRETPLLIAAKYNFTEVAALLIKHNANIMAVDIIRFTPLHWAAKNGNKELINLLLEAEADINAQNVSGRTALDLAKPAIKKYLISKGAKYSKELL